MLFRGGGGGVGGGLRIKHKVTRYRCHSQRANIFCVLYNVVSEDHRVQKSPWGRRGVYSQLKAYALLFCFSFLLAFYSKIFFAGFVEIHCPFDLNNACV